MRAAAHASTHIRGPQRPIRAEIHTTVPRRAGRRSPVSRGPGPGVPVTGHGAEQCGGQIAPLRDSLVPTEAPPRIPRLIHAYFLHLGRKRAASAGFTPILDGRAPAVAKAPPTST